jgi:hypothetical protein
MRAESGQNYGNKAIGIDRNRRALLAANEIVKHIEKLVFHQCVIKAIGDYVQFSQTK